MGCHISLSARASLEAFEVVQSVLLDFRRREDFGVP